MPKHINIDDDEPITAETVRVEEPGFFGVRKVKKVIYRKGQYVVNEDGTPYTNHWGIVPVRMSTSELVYGWNIHHDWVHFNPFEYLRG